MKKLTDDKEKMEIVSKLVKEGTIDFSEAIKLLEEDVEKEYVYIPNTITMPYVQPSAPMVPSLPWYQTPLPIIIGAGEPVFSTPYSGTIVAGDNGAISSFVVNYDPSISAVQNNLISYTSGSSFSAN